MKMIFLIMIGLSIHCLADFTRHNGVVIDSKTSLEWQDEYRDIDAFSDKIKIKRGKWGAAIDYCESLTLNGKGWRLPNVNELFSIVDYSQESPRISRVFQSMIVSYYWTSTTPEPHSLRNAKIVKPMNVEKINYPTLARTSNQTFRAWVVEFSDGGSHPFSKVNTYYIRCVR